VYILKNQNSVVALHPTKTKIIIIYI